MIASKAEIKAEAFLNNFDVNAIKDNVITLVELEQVKPLLGETLYDLVVATPASYTALLLLVKPFIAYHTKYYITKRNHVKTDNKGTEIATGGSETPANPEDGKREALTFANKYKVQIEKYLEDNDLGSDRLADEDGIINGMIII